MSGDELRLFGCSDSTPEELKDALVSSGSWGMVYEPAGSGTRLHALDEDANVMLNTNIFRAASFDPPQLSIDGGAAGLGPFSIAVTLTQVSSWGIVAPWIHGVTSTVPRVRRLHCSVLFLVCVGITFVCDYISLQLTSSFISES